MVFKIPYFQKYRWFLVTKFPNYLDILNFTQSLETAETNAQSPEYSILFISLDMETSWILVSRKLQVDRPPLESDIPVCIDIEMSPGVELGRGTLRWRVDTGQSEVCRQLGEDEGWPADNGVRRRWRTRPCFPGVALGGCWKQPQTRGMGESAILPSTPPLPSFFTSLFSRLCPKWFTHSRATRGREALNISAYNYIALFRVVRYLAF